MAIMPRGRMGPPLRSFAADAHVGKAGSCRKVGATANLDSSCARRRERSAGRDEETGFQIEQRNDKKERCGALKLLDKKAHTRVTQRQRGRHGVGQCYSTCNFRGLPGASCTLRLRTGNARLRPGPDDRDQGALSRFRIYRRRQVRPPQLRLSRLVPSRRRFLGSAALHRDLGLYHEVRAKLLRAVSDCAREGERSTAQKISRPSHSTVKSRLDFRASKLRAWRPASSA